MFQKSGEEIFTKTCKPKELSGDTLVGHETHDSGIAKHWSTQSKRKQRNKWITLMQGLR